MTWDAQVPPSGELQLTVPIRADDFVQAPDRPCAIFNGGSVTYAEVNELSDRLAGALAAMGVKRGDPVGIFMPNTPQFVIAFFAILKAGGAVVATNPLYTPREIEHQMKDAGCEIMLVMSNFYGKTKEVQSRTRLKTLIVTNVKEYLPPVLKVLFTLAKEKKGGHRVTLGSGDVWLQDLLAKYKASDRPKLALTSEDLAIFQYSGGLVVASTYGRGPPRGEAWCVSLDTAARRPDPLRAPTTVRPRIRSDARVPVNAPRS